MKPAFYPCALCGKDHRSRTPAEAFDPTLASVRLVIGKEWELPVIHDESHWVFKQEEAYLCSACVVPLLDYLKEKGILK